MLHKSGWIAGLSAWFILPTAFCLAGKPEGSLKGFSASRTWSDATGRFKVEGQLEFADARNAQIKTSAGKLMSIPVEKLSEADRTFVQTFLSAETAMTTNGGGDTSNPFMAVDSASEATSKPTEDATFSEASSPDAQPKTSTSKNPTKLNNPGTEATKVPRRQINTRTSRPIPLSFDKNYWKGKPPFSLQLVEVPDLTIATDVAKPFFAGLEIKAAGKSPVALINVHEAGHRGNYSTFTAVSLVGGDTSPTVKLDVPIQLLALSPDGKRALGIKLSGADQRSALVVLNIDASGVAIDYEFVAGGGDWDELQWATFLPGNRVMTITQKHTVSIWDLGNPKAVTLYSRGNLGGPLPMFTSIGNDQIGIVNKQALAIVDASELRQIGCIVCDKPILAACFSHDGSKIGIQMSYELAVYSTTDGKLLKSIPISNPDKASLVVYGKYAMVGDLMYDVEAGIPFWTYEGASAAFPLADLLIRGFGGEQGTTITSAKLPHTAAIDAAANYGSQDRYALVPGTPVSVQVVVKGNFGQTKEIEEGIRENITKAGWKLSDDSDIVVIATLEQGKEQKEEYVTREGRFGPPPPFFNASGPVDEVTFTPWTHKVEIKQGDKMLFTNVRYVGSPQAFESKEGESTQATISRLVQPQTSYFKSVNLPPYIYKPELQNGFGKSKLEATGLQSAK